MIIVVTQSDGTQRRFADTPKRYPAEFTEYSHEVSKAGVLTVRSHHQDKQRTGDFTEYVHDKVVGMWPAGAWVNVESLEDEPELDVELDDSPGAGQLSAVSPASARTRPCMRCGNTNGAWAVTTPYVGSTGPGRLLIYCESCRSESSAQLRLSMPASLLWRDPSGTMLELYEQRIVGTDPKALAEQLEISDAWVPRAEKLLRRDER